MSPRPVFVLLSAIVGVLAACWLMMAPAESSTPSLVVEKPVVKKKSKPKRPVLRRMVEPTVLEDVPETHSPKPSTTPLIEEQIDKALAAIDEEGLEAGILWVRIVDKRGEAIPDASLSLHNCIEDIRASPEDYVDTYSGSYHAVRKGDFWIPLLRGSCRITASRPSGRLYAQVSQDIRIRPGEVERVLIELEDEKGGLGFHFMTTADDFKVVAVFKDTPAWDAGLRAGDRIRKIDGRSVEGMTSSDFIELSTGVIGESVVLSVFRDLGSSGAQFIGMKMEREYLPEDLEMGDGLHHWD